MSRSVSVSVPLAVGVPVTAFAGLDHRAGRGAGNDGRVVSAVDGDRHHLAVPSMVVTVKLSVSMSPALSACTALLALSSV